MDPLGGRRSARRRRRRDAAQACGSEYRGRKVGAIGDAGALSFLLEKNITSGEGGALATRDEETYRRAVRYADQGGQFPIQSGGVRDTVGGDPVMGENLRMSEIVGAILGCQLARLDGMLTRVVEVRRAVEEGLSGLPIELPTPAPERDLHALGVLFYLPTAETADRVAEALQAEGVPAGKVYGGAPVYASRQILERRTLTRGCPFSCTCTDHRKPEYWMGMCPRSEDLLARGVGIAVGPRYSDEDVADVVHGLRKVLEQLV
ncbi:MAG: DegT/DnrJ/EryC1/StrS family aminotransferase [Chloroflexia bacterium]